MSKVIIVLVIILLLAVGGVVLYLKTQSSTKTPTPPSTTSQTPPSQTPPSATSQTPPSATSTTPPSTTSTTPPPQSNLPKDAVCSIENTFTKEGITEVNKDDNYTFEIMKLGKELKDNIEKFAFLSTAVYDINQLDNNTVYYIGNLKPSSQITTVTPPLNGGRNCLTFPQTVYLQAPNSPPIQYIRIKRITTAPDGANAINLSEIQAFDLNNKLITPASVSYNDEGIGFPATNAIDGNFNNFAHTSNNMGSYIQLAFSSPVTIGKIIIGNRTDCCQVRMIGTSLQLFSTTPSSPDVANIPITDTRGTYTFTFNGRSWTLS